ncbi:hypothetical protein [Actinosynnema sp. ALI-1.44]|uniref:hypothetical protein n=1 Tax=Actinosynnema sp. ALI-1.44 TaxID=1933779 RepID=UPI00192CF98E|nr:hypothetical protein [Actinosynnema sp. ALI-1.44]
MPNAATVAAAVETHHGHRGRPGLPLHPRQPLRTADEVFRSREFLLRRVGLIAANPALAERDLIKLADIAGARARALEGRGVESGEARFIADVAIAIALRATSCWIRQ